MSDCVHDPIRHNIAKRISSFEQGYRQNIGLVGRWGCGKSHILMSVYRSLIGHASLIPVYIDAEVVDFSHLAERWVSAVLHGLFVSQAIEPPSQLDSLLRAAELIIPESAAKIQQFLKTIGKEKSSVLVRQLFSLSGQIAKETKKKIVLMIDEFHLLEDVPVQDPFVLLGKEIMAEKDTLYLVASSSVTKAKEIFNQQLSLLFGNFEVVEVEPFSVGELAEYFNKRLEGYASSPAQIKFLFKMTDGVAFYVDCILSRLEFLLGPQYYQQIPILNFEKKDIPENSFIEAFAAELWDSRSGIANLFCKKVERCRLLEKTDSVYLRLLMALGQNRHRILNVAALVGQKIRDTQKMLMKLWQTGQVVRSGAFFYLDDSLFRFWLREVFQRRCQNYSISDEAIYDQFVRVLRDDYHREISGFGLSNVSSTLEGLFNEFKNDTVDLYPGQKKMSCPQFTEVVCHPAKGIFYPMMAKKANVRWGILAVGEFVREEDVKVCLEEFKRFGKKIQKKILIVLSGLDQNAKLIAQEAKIQILDLDQINKMLVLFGKEKIITLPENKTHETRMGAVAQVVHSA